MVLAGCLSRMLRVDFIFTAHCLFSGSEMFGFHRQIAGEIDQENLFHKCLEATRTLFRRYKHLDAAIALGVSELWPVNTGSPTKHIFASGPEI